MDVILKLPLIYIPLYRGNTFPGRPKLEFKNIFGLKTAETLETVLHHFHEIPV